MTFGYLNNLNIYSQSSPNVTFGAKHKPAQKISNDPIEKLVERVDEEKKKKHNKAAIAVGSSVLGVSLFVALLNPKNSSRIIQKLKGIRINAKQNMEKSKDKILASKFYKAIAGAADWSSRFLSSINNVNSVKDTYFKQLCTEEKTFFSVKNVERRNRLKKVDNIVRKILKRPHELITEWGDSLAKRTVRKSYKKSGRAMDSLELLIKEYSNKLPADKKSVIMEKLNLIKNNRNYFSTESINDRFAKQEKLMESLNSDIRQRWRSYKHGFEDKFVSNSEHFDKNLSFWAQDMLQANKEALSKEGKAYVDGFVGNKDNTKGLYRELVEILSNSLNPEEKSVLNNALNKTEKRLRYANKQECYSYFDKKRDLVLGSAPTDIVTAGIGLTAGGIALAIADNKDDKISKLFTGVLPAIFGIGTNIALTTMLFSGTKGLLTGIVAGGVMSLFGSKIDKARLMAKKQKETSIQMQDTESKFDKKA